MADAQAGRSLPPILQWAVLALTVAAAGWLASNLISSTDFLPVHDFCEYWAAGKLNLEGSNPYDPDELYQVQKPLGLVNPQAVIMWNPPWTLSLVMPLALLPFRAAQLLWALLQIGVIIYCADLTWRLYGGPLERRWLSWLLAGLFTPMLFMVKGGQISGFMLLGAAGFLHFEQRGQLFLAGVMAALLGIKPQLFYLFWFALLFWSLHRREWRIIAGGVCAGVLASLPPLLFNPEVFAQYWHAVTHYPPKEYMTTTLGTLLRLAAGEPYAGLNFRGDYFELQYVPPALGVLVLAWWWYRHRHDWSWPLQMPLLLLVGMFTAAYGAWSADLVVLLIPVIQAAVWVLPPLTQPSPPGGEGRVRGPAATWTAVAAYVAINGAAMVSSVLNVDAFWYIWMGPTILTAWLLVRRLAGQQRWS